MTPDDESRLAALERDRLTARRALCEAAAMYDVDTGRGAEAVLDAAGAFKRAVQRGAAFIVARLQESPCPTSDPPTP